MTNRLPFLKSLAALTLILFLFNISPVQAAVAGRIQSLNPLPDGRLEVVVEEAGKSTRYVVSRKTQITVFVTAADVRSGSHVYIVELPGESGGSGGRGFKPPFGNLSASLKKKLNLPEIPGVPSVPSAQNMVPQIPGVPKIPSAPKAPQIPQVPTAKNPAPQPAEAGESAGNSQGKPRSKANPPEAQPSEEEKSLFGRVDSGRSLLPKGGEGFATQPEKTVTRVRKVKAGVQLSLKNREGKNEKTVLDSNHPILEKLSLADLRTNMTVQIEAAGQGQEILRMKVVG